MALLNSLNAFLLSIVRSPPIYHPGSVGALFAYTAAQETEDSSLPGRPQCITADAASHCLSREEARCDTWAVCRSSGP